MESRVSTRTEPSRGGAEQITLSIHGMTCAGCVAAVERALKSVPGVREAEVR